MNVKFTSVNKYIYISENIVERGSSVVECRTRNRESPGSNPLNVAIVSKFGHFRSLHDASVDSAV